MTNFLFLFVIVLALAYLTNYFLSHSFLGPKWRLFVAPGVIFHELCHAFACKLTFAKITKISFFDKHGGEVVHHPSPIPILGPILISTAPLILGILVFYFLANRVQVGYSTSFSDIYINFKELVSTIDLGNWLNILFIYLLISVAVTMTPSKQDFQNMFIPLIILSITVFLILKYTNLNYGHFDYTFSKLTLVLNLAVFILLVFSVGSLALHLISKFVFKKA